LEQFEVSNLSLNPFLLRISLEKVENYAIPMAARQEPVSELLMFAVPIAMGAIPIAMGINTTLYLLQGLIIEAVEDRNWNCGLFIAPRRRYA